jgi:hypothetical protein
MCVAGRFSRGAVSQSVVCSTFGRARSGILIFRVTGLCPPLTSLAQFLKRFPDHGSCWSRLEALRWPHSPVCPKRGNVGPTRKCGRKQNHQCKVRRARYTAAFGTPLEGTHLPLRTWFMTLQLRTTSGQRPSGVALTRHIGSGQKAAWFLEQRVRAAMQGKSTLLGGIVEADETYVGGRRTRDPESKRDDDNHPKRRGGASQVRHISGQPEQRHRDHEDPADFGQNTAAIFRARLLSGAGRVRRSSNYPAAPCTN